METIVLKPLFQDGKEWIGLYYDNLPSLNTLVRKLAGAKWNQDEKCWYVPLNAVSYNRVYKALYGKAGLEISALKQYLLKRKQVAATAPGDSIKKNSRPVVSSSAWNISKENLNALQKFIEQLKLKAYSPSTIRTYRNEFLQLLQLLKNKPVDLLTTDDLRRYMVYAMEIENIGENTAHSRLNALKFYFEQVLKQEKFFWEIPRPKKPLRLPNVLGEQEITRLFNALTNVKHKAMLLTAYSSGLRVSEVVKLRLRDIDSDRMQIKVEDAKGKKDRYVMLSPLVLVF